MLRLIALMTVQSLFLVISQVFLKRGLVKIGFERIDLAFVLGAVRNPGIWLSVIFIVLSGVIWLFVLRNYEFHVAYPLVSISYIFSLLASRYFLNENISAYSIIGVVFIIVGIFFITFRRGVS